MKKSNWRVLLSYDGAGKLYYIEKINTKKNNIVGTVSVSDGKIWKYEDCVNEVNAYYGSKGKILRFSRFASSIDQKGTTYYRYNHEGYLEKVDIYCDGVQCDTEFRPENLTYNGKSITFYPKTKKPEKIEYSASASDSSYGKVEYFDKKGRLMREEYTVGGETFVDTHQQPKSLGDKIKGFFMKLVEEEEED